MTYLQLNNPDGSQVKAWVRGVFFDANTREQLLQTATLPCVWPHLAAMPDCHLGKGSTVGSVIPTRGAIIPAAVGVDLGCGMMAVRTSLRAEALPDDLAALRNALESVVPVGPQDWSTGNFARHRDRAALSQAWHTAETRWQSLQQGYADLMAKYPQIEYTPRPPEQQLGSLGGGNHFIELCLDEDQQLWLMLHSGSRGIGNRIGSYFITRAREEAARLGLDLPNQDLAYLAEGSPDFDDYVQAVSWAQQYARSNREVMMTNLLQVLAQHLPPFALTGQAVNCHHNYIARESHFGEALWLTRKGAIRAGKGELGIIPGSMGARSFIVRGLGHAESFESCSHGAGRVMSRTAARKKLSLADHEEATAGVECRKDIGVLDESPAAYKDIDAVMAAQADLVEIVHTLKQVVCIKG